MINFILLSQRNIDDPGNVRSMVIVVAVFALAMVTCLIAITKCWKS